MENGKKRPREEPESDTDQDQPQKRRMRPMPSFVSVIRGALMAETIKSICSSLEPVIRRVVHDEVQLIVCGTNPLYGNRQYYIEQPPPPSPVASLNNRNLLRHELIFVNEVPPSIFTGNNITGKDNHPIQIQLVDTETSTICKNEEGSDIKVKIMVIDGDLEPEGLDSDKFSSNVVKPRDGRRPLLVGNIVVTLNQGVATIRNLSFTDNSKWLRSGKFRLGACVDSENCRMEIKIKEGLSDKFSVKDHRGELYKKHHPPMPNDEVWRLESIAKDGKFHQRLKEKGVNNVGVFLQMLNKSQSELKEILKMSQNAWDKVVKHARTCPVELGDAELSFDESNADLPNWPQESEAGTNPTNLNGPEFSKFDPLYTELGPILTPSLPDFWGNDSDTYM